MPTILIELIKILPAILSALFELFRKRKTEEPPVPEPVPVPEPEPIPPVDPPTDDHLDEQLYLKLSVAKGYAEKLEWELQENAWAGWRDPEAVARYCPDVPPLPPADELLKLAKIGQDLDHEGSSFLTRLGMPHKKYSDRSVVRKLVWAEFYTRLQDHLEESRGLRDLLKKEPGAGVAWDSIKGWCEYKRKNP